MGPAAAYTMLLPIQIGKIHLLEPKTTYLTYLQVP